MAKLYFLGELNKTPSDGTLLGRTSRRFLWCWLLLLFFLTGGFYVFRAIFLCHRHSAPASQAREGFHRPWALPWLLSVALLFPRLFRHSFTASVTFLSGNFLSTGIFYLTLLRQHFWNSLWLRWSRIILCAYPHRVVPSGWRMDLNYSYCSYKAIDLSIAPVSHKA